MPKVYALTCPHCRAPLPAIPPGTAMVTCEYCGKSSNVSHTLHMPSQAPAPAPVRPAPATGGSRVVRMMLINAAIGACIWCVYFAVKTLRSAPDLQDTAVTAQASNGVSARATERLTWAGGPLVVTDVDGDGTEDVIGFYNLFIEGQHDPTTALGAFSGTTWKRLWQTPSLGQSANLDTAVALVGDTVVFVDATGLVRVLDRKTGAERERVTLTDRATQVCPSDATHAWIAVADETNVLVDLATGTTVKGKRPATCPAPTPFAECSSWDSDDQGAMSATCIAHAESDLTAPGMRVSYAIRAGTHAIAVGTKDKGTTISMLAGYEAAHLKGAPRWIRRVHPDATAMTPTGDIGALDIVGDVGVLAYDADGTTVKVQRFDAATGAIQWEAVVPKANSAMVPSTLVVTDTRIYAAYFIALAVFDAKTGALVTILGGL